LWVFAKSVFKVDILAITSQKVVFYQRADKRLSADLELITLSSNAMHKVLSETNVEVEIFSSWFHREQIYIKFVLFLYYLAKNLSTYDFFYLTKSSFITFDLMKVNWKKVIPLAGAFVAYRIWKLYELGSSIQWSVASVDFLRPVYVQDSLNQFAIRVRYRINNPTKTTLNLRMITGEMSYAGVKIGTFQTKEFKLVGGEQFLDADFFIGRKEVVASLVDAVASRKYPIVNVSMTYYLPMFSYTEKFDVNIRDYVNLDRFNIFK
jgi:hypothetical protein